MPFIQTRVHGNAVVVQRTEGIVGITDDNGNPAGRAAAPLQPFILPGGSGSTFTAIAPGAWWFHVPIPTVAYLQTSPMDLSDLFVFFTSSEPAVGVSAVHIWDGGARVWDKNLSPPMKGNWSGPRTFDRNSNTWAPLRNGLRIRMHTGLNVSLLAEFSDRGALIFHSAGATFVDSESP